MIAAWMAYTFLVGALFGVAAVAFEAGMRWARLPGRWAYVTALVGAVVVPVVTRGAPELPPADPSFVVGATSAVSLSAIPWFLQVPTGSADLDTPLVVFWIIAASLVLAILIGTQARIARANSRYLRETIDGTQVLRSGRIGPAVVGWWRASIVLPAWVDEIHLDWRRMVVLHETEHRRSGDSQLMFAATVLAALLPWNLSLWWMVLRLRNAIELDCDRRVLRSGVDVRAYGNLLLDIGTRRNSPGLSWVGFSVTKPFLARRFDILVGHMSRARYASAGLACVAALSLVALACTVPSPIKAEADERPVLEEEFESPYDSSGVSEHTPVLLPDSAVPVMRVMEFLDAVAAAGNPHMAVDTMALAGVPQEILEQLKATALLLQVLEKDGKPTVLIREITSRGQEQLRRISAIERRRAS